MYSYLYSRYKSTQSTYFCPKCPLRMKTANRADDFLLANKLQDKNSYNAMH